MQQTCTSCSRGFSVTAEDRTFLDNMAPTFAGRQFSPPDPELCPDCRHQRRMAFRNERRLYKRTCDATQKPILSLYEADAPWPVYEHEAWWSDDWDALQYGRDYDPDRPFFEQFHALLQAVPRVNIVTGHNQNCDYCNYVNYSKASYLCFGCHAAEECFHSWRVHWSSNCADCLQLDKCKWCYECIDCEDCYNLRYAQDCTTCHDSDFLSNCKGCHDCLFCTNLRNAEYCVFNQPYSQAEYEQKRAEYGLDTWAGREKARQTFADWLQQQPCRGVFVLNAEQVSGDHIRDSRHLHECYHVRHAEDCRYLESCEEIKDSMDNTFSGWPAERVYETMSAGVNCYNFLYCTTCWSCSNLLYCDSCHHSSDLFGCVGLRSHNQYCVLNKQYSQQEYEALVVTIMENMMERGEWGKFFPAEISPHAYNETVAQEFYPLTETEAKQRGYGWKPEVTEAFNVEKTIQASQLPSQIADVPDDVLNWAIVCEVTGKPFRIIRQELEFYRTAQLPLPQQHPDERHRRRMSLRSPRQLWARTCCHCQQDMQTTYAPDRPEQVYCEDCFLKEVY